MPSTYVCDSNSFGVISNYYPTSFPQFWERLHELIEGGRFGSVREVKKELDNRNASDHLESWCEQNLGIFPTPSESEMAVVADIFRVPHFEQLIGEKQRLRGTPVADPFLIARARDIGGVVVTEELLKPNAAKIPNVCAHFGVEYCTLEALLTREGWRF